ncbi:MAG: ornithine carbamoyltransferase [Eubacteriales bacterium]
MNLKGRSFLKLKDFTPGEIDYLLNLAADLKAKKKAGVPHNTHAGKNIVLIFEKTSTRTRCSFEVAAYDLGVGTVCLEPSNSQIGRKESIADTARVLGRMFDGIEYRGYGQEIVEELARHSGVPVWNGLTNEFHPTQILADFLTIKEKFGRLKGIKLVYMGDARYNMGNSLMVGSSKMGLCFTASSPKEYFPDKSLVSYCEKEAEASGGSISLVTDPIKAARGADVVYTDVWVSMGEPAGVWEKRLKALYPYQVNENVMRQMNDGGVFMHCLPAYHNRETEIGREIGKRFGLNALEVTEEVFESDRSIVFDQAENRMHTIKAVIAATL